MNIIKGIDRIVLVIAILAILPGFLAGAALYYDMNTKVKPEYPNMPVPSYGNWPYKYVYPPWYDCIFPGILGSGISFVVCLYGIRLGTRGVKHFSLWIRDGFREDTSKKRDR